jgi:hypothetical protein
MGSWDSLTIAEQTLMRRAVAQNPLAGTIQAIGTALRWAGAEDAPPPRSYSEAEQGELVPRLGAVLLGLTERGLVSVREVEGCAPAASAPAVTGEQLRAVLADRVNWVWNPDSPCRFRLAAPDAVRERWGSDMYPTADVSGLPAWDELSTAQRDVLVCAAEASGMLTGPFGVWEDPPNDLSGAARLDWIDRQLAPLLPFVRAGWIEVQHHPEADSDAFTVIPLGSLRSALADPTVRYEGDEWGVGVGCTFTYAGLAIWRGGWSAAWSSRLTIR